VVLNIESSDPGVFALQSSTVTLAPGAQLVQVMGRALRPGNATLRLSGGSANITVAPDWREQPLRVQ
jgi:hypothetical protein